MNTMNIVWLSPEVPYPPIGGRNGVFNRIVQLSKYNSIFLFSIAYSDEEKASSFEMKKFCKQVYYYNRNESKFKTLIRSMFIPYSVASRTIIDIKKDLKNVLAANNIDVIIVDFPNMAKNLLGVIEDGQYCTLNQHNIEYIRMRNMAKVKKLPFYKKAAYYLESFRLEYYERYIYNKKIFGSITFFSQEDIEFFNKRWTPNKNIKLKLFPLGANISSVKTERKYNNTLLFIGRLDNIAIPNVEAAIWLVEKVLPIVKKQIPDIKVFLAGANPSKEIVELKSENVDIIPNFEKIEDVYSLSDVVVLPLLSGGGVKGKLLEAAAFEKIIVTTKHGIEGTTFEPDKHVLLGNNAEKFAEHCINALSNIDKYQALAEASRELFERDYDWNIIGKRYNDFLNEEIQREITDEIKIK